MFKNLPNIITTIRIALIPVFSALYLSKQFNWAILILAIVMLTDVLDGYIARKFSLQTRIGELLDPLADKLAQIMICVCLYITKLLPIWFLIAIILKEFTMLIAGSVASFGFKKQHAITKARWYGKVATVCFYAVICANFVFPTFFLEHSTIRTIGFVVAIICEYFAFVNYGLDFLKKIK